MTLWKQGIPRGSFGTLSKPAVSLFLLSQYRTSVREGGIGFGDFETSPLLKKAVEPSPDFFDAPPFRASPNLR
jgi:hypothetical protein